MNALVLAKVMLVAQDLHLGHRFEDRPLIYPVLIKSLLFAIVFICFHVVEHVIIGLWYGKGILQSMPGFGGGGIDGVIMVGVLMSVALIPFFAFTEISRFFGPAALQTLIFKRGPKEFVVELRLRKQNGQLEVGGRQQAEHPGGSGIEHGWAFIRRQYCDGARQGAQPCGCRPNAEFMDPHLAGAHRIRVWHQQDPCLPGGHGGARNSPIPSGAR